MSRGLVVEDLGRLDYTAAHARQLQVLAERISGDRSDTLLVVEHDPVFTLGRRRTSSSNVLDPGNVPVIQVERGGDVTFHGPGQVVVYPIVGLEGPRADLHDHLRRLEEAAIQTLADFGLEGRRDPRNSGAWIRGRKVCSVGIACRRWVTWHGLALNVDLDLAFFRRIRPCGLSSEEITSMAEELEGALDRTRVKATLVAHLQDQLR